MEAFVGGNARAFERLLKRHQRPVFNFVCRLVGDRAAAEDIFQELFFRVIKAAPDYHPRARFTTWMYTIARNLCVDHVRRSKHRAADSLDGPAGRGGPSGGSTGGSTGGSNDGSIEQQVMGLELQDRLQQALERLPGRQREVFLMREYLNLRFVQIAEVVGCSENTAKSRMRYALEYLRTALREYRDVAEAVR